jgi:hypothetical protein
VTRQRLIAEAKRIAREIDQIFLDAEHWNAAHPHEEPIDPDPDGVLRRIRAGLPETTD